MKNVALPRHSLWWMSVSVNILSAVATRFARKLMLRQYQHVLPPLIAPPTGPGTPVLRRLLVEVFLPLGEGCGGQGRRRHVVSLRR